jgi:hypothetical protein
LRLFWPRRQGKNLVTVPVWRGGVTPHRSSSNTWSRPAPETPLDLLDECVVAAGAARARRVPQAAKIGSVLLVGQ